MSRIIGIDLGTSTSEIAYIEDGNPILIPNSLGKLITPSVVHIGEDGEILVSRKTRNMPMSLPVPMNIAAGTERRRRNITVS